MHRNILSEIHNNYIQIEEHTDNDPINSSKFSSNWELPSARATNVLRRLVAHKVIDPSKSSAVGYGEFRPKVPNDMETNKAKNRRVDIVIIREGYDKGESKN